MSYVKQNFVDGQTLTAAQLNHMEAGIANAAGTQGEKGDKGEKGVKLRSNIQYVGTDRLEDSRTTVDNFLREDKSINLGTSHSRQQNHERNLTRFQS